jgi:hypothetical protein
LNRLLARSRRLLAAEHVDAVLVMGDRHIGWETALIKAANERDLATLIVPFAISDPDSDIQGRLRKADLDLYRASSLMDRLAQRFYPDWVRESPAGPLYFFPIGEALAAQALGMMPQRPWSIGGGAARRMAVESPLALKNYVKEGIPRQKMVVTGKPSNDQIVVQMNLLDPAELRAELGLHRTQQMILCSVPQLAEHKLLPWEDHWQEIEFLFASLSQVEGARTILSLHPQSDPDRYRELADQYGAVIANRRIYDLVPICDLLVATYSSVVVQAMGCGKPALVVDFYGLDFSYYDNEPGVVILKDRNALVPTIKRLVRDRFYYQQLAEAQKRRAREWILLDGHSTQRVVDELYQMLKK